MGCALIIQRETGLRSYESRYPIKSGSFLAVTFIDFNPESPMHDGAVILQNTLVEAAGYFAINLKVR